MDIEKYLSNFYNGTKNPSLKAMKYFMDEFSHPEQNLKIIHIAGTNGKGSCACMMTNVLIDSGYKVGKFISPHLINYNERISIQNKDISNKDMEDLIKEIAPKVEKYNSVNDTKITLFELETTMALLYFYKKRCDFVVLETGLGGTFDCTNIVKPLVSIITSIGYDHMQILGNTLSEIARNKAGIIKRNSNTIFIKSENSDVNQIIIDKCKKENNELRLIQKVDISNYTYDKEFQKFDYKNYKDIIINLKGIKQIYTASIIIECSEILNNLGFFISEKMLKRGLKNVIHKGRFEILFNNPTIIYEGGHNEPAIENFINSINMYYKNESKVYIVQLLKTKDYKNILKLLLNDKHATFIFTNGNDKDRYWEKKDLLNYANTVLIDSNNLYAMELDEAIKKSKKIYKDKIIFIVGSFYVYGDVQNILENLK